MIDLSGSFGAGVAAFIIASLGTWWFVYVLKGLKQVKTGARRAIFASIWLAYFVLAWILATRF